MWRLAFAASLIPVFLTPACAFRHGVANNAVQLNVAIDEAHNRTLLLNVIRAAQREPMHFTELSKVTADIKGQAGVAFAIPFSGDNDATFMNPAASLSGGPTYEVFNLATKDFVSGIQSPVAASTFKHF